MTDPIEYGRACRDLWTLEDETIFLNHGSFGATPRAVLEAQAAWRARMEQQPVRFLFKELRVLLRLAAEELAQFLGAAGEDLVFVDNATTGVNTVLASAPMAPGDEVLTTDHAYPAVLKSLERTVHTRGVELVVAEVPFPIVTAEQMVTAVADAITPRTRLVVVDAITSPTALVFPVADLVTLCRERGVPILVDGAHAPGMIELDLDTLGADYYTGNCHKWLCAPKGCAFLWVAPERQSDLHPLVTSHGYGEGFVTEFDWTGTRDPSAWLSVTAALSFHQELGGIALRRRNHELALAAATLLAEAWGTELPAPPSMLGSMAPIAAPGRHTADLETAISMNDQLRAEHSIEAPVIPFANRIWIRISAQAYNEIEEYQALAEAALVSFG